MEDYLGMVLTSVGQRLRKSIYVGAIPTGCHLFSENIMKSSQAIQKVIEYIQSERKTLKVLQRDSQGFLGSEGELVDTILSNIEYLLTFKKNKDD